jgi:RNA polymerase sigma factor (sigma-70 family)
VRAVNDTTDASREVVEDACMFAWKQFMRYQPDRDRGWRRWLITTAQREVWQLTGVERDHDSLDDPLSSFSSIVVGDQLADPHDQVEIRSRLRRALGALAHVPERRRQVKALHVTGYTYDEIGERLGMRYTRVNALIAEANRTIRAEWEKADPQPVEMTERPALLDQSDARSRRLHETALGSRAQRLTVRWNGCSAAAPVAP